MSEAYTPNVTMGIFETLLVVDGSPVELDAHLERLSSSAAELFAAALPADTRGATLEHASTLALGRLRLTVAPRAARASSDRTLSCEVVTAAVDSENVFPAWQRAIALSAFHVPGGVGAHKWADRAALASMEASLADGWLPLLVDDRDELLEGSRANVFAVEQDALVTPATDGRILPGVARARAIESARALGIEVREEALGLDRLIGAGEGFLTGSVRGIEPVRCVGDVELSPLGRVASELAADMQRLWIGEGAPLDG